MGRVPAALRACGASLVLAVVSALAGCAAQCQEHFASIREGMDREQVQAILGKPSSKWPGERPGEEGTERWQYGDNLSSLATSGVFRDADTSRVYVIWFDKDGKVASFSEPDWAKER
jgi:outer membrane protein assembly factor BamE (lipoprotein component of BamABCDE complex)